MPDTSPSRPPGTKPEPATARRAARIFELVHKLLTGGAALAMLVKLLFG
jgi:hypothetical protein